MVSVLDKAQQGKKEAEERLSRGGGFRAQFWKPKNGKNDIRIMPPWTDPYHEDKELDEALQEFEGQFWRQVAQHWNVSEDQRGPILCPKETPGLEGDCPICEFVSVLKGDKSNVQAQETAKEIRAKTTFIYNIVDQKDPEYTAEDVAEFKKNRPDADCPFEPGDTKVQLYAAPLTVHDAILGMITANQQDVTKLDTGRNIMITRHPHKDPKKTRYEVTPQFNPSEFDLKGDLPQLHQQGFLMKYDEMLDLLQSGVGGDFVAALPEGGDSEELPEDTLSGNDVTEDFPQESKDATDLASELQAAVKSQ